MIKPLLLTLALASTQLAAEETVCEKMAGFAQTVMENRQAGVPLVKMIKITDNELLQDIIKTAYKRPQYPEGYRTKPVTDFQNDIYLECLWSMD
ncbi:MAG: hypothetical protein Tp136SUR676911_3 [Prokaryotic dsDNA virus sp.]|jgi:hypothetical protein|nr:MAG: hypothetical protein Tp136SUR676911_3 [Prokaryotic dsDNA virus sp.]|tara:strand:- start:1976 stop:2257 length:282 start_codon:yes stop_codon:yes gene_type:complete